MSYARFGSDGGSDVYVFLSTSGSLECCGCPLSDVSQHFDTTVAIVDHLREHQDAGHKVPTATFVELERDRAENDAWIAEGAPEDGP